MTTSSDEEWLLSLDEADPLHSEMMAYLRAVRRRGRYSPVRRILTRWACNGYLLELGRIPGNGTGDPAAVFDALAALGLLASHATPEALVEALEGLSTSTQSTRRPRLDLAEAQREIAAISASAASINFE